jgi:immune inhibitor A
MRLHFFIFLSLATLVFAPAGCAQQPEATVAVHDLLPVVSIPPGPDRDPFDLARRYKGIDAESLPNATLFPEEPFGTEHTFKVMVGTGPEVRETQAILRHVGARALWYVEQGVALSQASIEAAAQTFDADIYPHVTGTLAPDVALPGRITVLNAILSQVGGYFSSADLLPVQVDPDSNERTMITLDPALGFGSQRYLGTLAHELQHLLHNRADPNEETWINEGLSEFAARSAGLPALPEEAYLRRPETSVARWPEEVGASLPSYAGTSLFIQYLADRTGGPTALGRLMTTSANGAAGVQEYLEETVPGLRFDELFADWAVANYVGASSGPFASPGQTIGHLPGSVVPGNSLAAGETLSVQLPQFGAWYAQVSAVGQLEVTFQGAEATPLLPAPPPDGKSCWWSNRGDQMDATLNRSLDLRSVRSATLRFWSWHAIEDGYDFGYVAVSTDGGETWTALEGSSTVEAKRALGPAFTGNTDGWVQVEVDLSAYAGAAVLLRFEYVTDESITSDGWCVADITILELGPLGDAMEGDEESANGWTMDGFYHITGRGVAQRFEVRLVRGQGDDALVELVSLDEHNRAVVTVDSFTVLVVTATADTTRQPAIFTVEARLP